MRTGGSRWITAAGVAAATALIAAAGLTLTGERPELSGAAVGVLASTAEAPARTSTAPDPTRTPSAAASSQSGTSVAESEVPASSLAPSTTAPGSSAASTQPTPSAAVVTGTPSPPEYPTVPGASPDAPFVSFIGDSWTAGVGATDEVGYAPLTGRLLGWQHRVLGVGGSGYVRGGSGNVPFDERIPAAVAGNPDVVVVQGTINERSTPSPELAAAVTDTLTRLVAGAGPDTTVLVVGASHVPGVPVQYVDKVNDVVRAEAARQGLLFVDVAAEVWSDPADPSIWADPYHVNDAGARAIAERLAPVLEGLVSR